ncbi:MAG: patatin-like phospholipase family protein [Planctomycetaceae bacterium]
MAKSANDQVQPAGREPAQLRDDEQRREPEDGMALCLSGGGYRAMLFHAGALIRLNEMGLLPKLARVSSVSGGSIVAGVLGLNWNRLQFDANGRTARLSELVIGPLQKMAKTNVDTGSVLSGVLLPGSVSDRVVGHYQNVLFGDATLQDLPTDAQGPRFVFNATSVQTGSLVRMSRPYLADYRVGLIHNPKISLAQAVAASSAFPPFLSPTEIDVDPSDFEVDASLELQHEPYTDTLVLTDGGVYDNLGLEPVWKRYRTILVSDGGGQMQPEPEPDGDWARHSKRILDIVDNQVRSLRKRQLIDSFINGTRNGAYWGIRTDIDNYQLANSLPAPADQTLNLANTPTRLKKTPVRLQQQLMNWGYAVCDAAIRKHSEPLVADNSVSPAFPFDAGLA